jgi:hypothetical protein
VDEIGEIVTGREIVEMHGGLFDRGVAFEVALHADGIALGGREFIWVENIFCAESVSVRVTVTTLTGNSGLRKKWRGVFVVGAGCGRVESAGVAVKARHRGGKIEGHASGGFVGGSHVPGFALRVPIYGSFEGVTVIGEKIGTSALTRADEIEEFALAFERFAGGAIETQPGFVVLFVDTVMNAGSGVSEFAGDESLHGGARGFGHGGFGVVADDVGVTVGAVFAGGGRGILGLEEGGD